MKNSQATFPLTHSGGMFSCLLLLKLSTCPQVSKGLFLVLGAFQGTKKLAIGNHGEAGGSLSAKPELSLTVRGCFKRHLEDTHLILLTTPLVWSGHWRLFSWLMSPEKRKHVEPMSATTASIFIVWPLCNGHYQDYIIIYFHNCVVHGWLSMLRNAYVGISFSTLVSMRSYPCGSSTALGIKAIFCVSHRWY